jgi:hypothetical protein
MEPLEAVTDTAGTTGADWPAANRAWLDAALRALRLRLHRRVLWLRRQWKHDPLQAYQGLVISDAQADGLLAGEDPEAEWLFYRESPDTAPLRSALDKAERAAAELRRGLAAAGAPAALDLLGDLLGLGGFERDVLLLCFAPEIDPAFERLYAYLQDDASRRHATPHLAIAVCAEDGEGRSAAREAFLPGAPLRRFRLVTPEPGPAGAAPGARSLRLDERIVEYLLGVNHPDERLGEILRPVRPAPLPAGHRDLVARLRRFLEAGAGRERQPLLNLIGAPGSGRLAVAQALCGELGVSLSRLDVSRLPAPGAEREDMLRVLEREAVLLQTALYLEVDPDPADRDRAALLGALVERIGAFFIAVGRERWTTERETLAVRVPRPDAGGRREVWMQALEGLPHTWDGSLDRIAQQFELGPQDVLRVVAAARDGARLRATESVAAGDVRELTPGDLWQAAREHAGGGLDELARRLVPCHTWEDLVLPDDTARQLREIADQVAQRARVYESWGFGAKLSRGRGIGALFAGPSGTGKTLAAEVLAGQLDLDLYRIDLSGVVSKYIGETEKNLRRVFDAAEQSGAILFFDEADALFGKRSEVKDSHDRYANIEVSYLLQRMEDYRGLAILATNLKSHLDPAFLRRLRFLVDFPFPDAAQRQRIWRRVFPPQAETEGLDHAALARLEIPGGNIKNIALNASFLAAGAGAPIRMEHVLHAARREYVKLERLISDTEFGAHRGGAAR